MQQNKWAIGAVVVVGIGILIALGLFGRAPQSQVISNTDDAAIRTTVQEFGTKLQMVSLLAPSEDRKAAMNQYYAPYVAPELLASWNAEDSQNALGRSTSSPWPERIEIVEVRPSGNSATVEGNVIEVANSATTTEAVAVYPVTLTLQKQNGKWLITELQKGAYSELPQRQTLIGVWECLPHKDTTGPQTDECAFGIAIAENSHYAIDTSLMETYPVDFPTGTKLRVTGIVTPVEQLNSIQKYDIDGIMRATTIEKI